MQQIQFFSSKQRKYIPYCTGIIILINIIVFLKVEFSSPFGSDDIEHMISCGAMYPPLFLEEGQYYRLVSEMFLHFGMKHLFNNMLVLWFLGGALEKEFGRTRYIILYFLSGILAGFSSLGYNVIIQKNVVSAGASGAIFGVVGALLSCVLRNRGKAGGYSVRQMLIFLALSIYSACVSAEIDWMAHLGGFIGGFLLAILIYPRHKKQIEDLDGGQPE